MSAPTVIRSTAGFRYVAIYELTGGLPLGATTRDAMTPYTVSGSTINSGSTVSVAAGATVSGSVGYYGTVISGAKVLTLNDPAPRVIAHTGDDGVITLQILPPQEPVTGELTVDKTNDTVDSIVAAVNKVTVGEMNLMGTATNKRGFENQVGLLAYSAAQDTDPASAAFGTAEWDFRVIPKTVLFTRDTGYKQDANERLYTVSPMYVTSHLWGVQFSVATEGFVRGQMLRGVSQYKPVIVGFKGDGVTTGFPFDSAQPAQAAAKVTVWKNGALLSTGFTKGLYGLSFAVAPLVTDVLTVLYESA